MGGAEMKGMSLDRKNKILFFLSSDLFYLIFLFLF